MKERHNITDIDIFHIARTMKEIRVKSGLSQQDLANVLGYHQNYRFK